MSFEPLLYLYFITFLFIKLIEGGCKIKLGRCTIAQRRKLKIADNSIAESPPHHTLTADQHELHISNLFTKSEAYDYCFITCF